MTLWRLILRNLAFHNRAAVAITAGVIAAAAALAGALVVGDSVKATLRQRALDRVFGANLVLGSGDKFFRQELKAIQPGAAPLIILPGVVRKGDGSATANNVQVLGVSKDYFASTARSANGPYQVNKPDQANGPDHTLGTDAKKVPQFTADSAWLSPALARQLSVNPGDEIVLRIRKPDLLSGDAALAPRDEQSVGWRISVAGVLAPENGGHLDLQGRGTDPLNVFVSLAALAERMGLPGKANQLLVPGPANDLAGKLAATWTFEDAGLSLRTNPVAGKTVLEVRSSSVFIPDVAVQAIHAAETNSFPVLTYLANLLVSGSNAIPYSMVTAAGQPYTPSDMQDDEIILNQWAADDLHVPPGDRVQLVYFDPESGSKLAEATNTFRLRAIAPIQGVYADRTLMPGFPGIEEAETTHDWKGGFPLEYTIRDKDEKYWDEYRGTPKAFVTLNGGQKLWGNRFGSVTAMRIPVPPGTLPEAIAANLQRTFLANVKPEQMGLVLTSVRDQALLSATQGQDFGQLFIGFSSFLVFGALLLVWLLFQLAVETRASETGTLMATGFARSRVRQMFIGEAFCLSIVGSLLGTVLGVLYAQGLLWGLRTVWNEAVGGLSFQLHVNPASLATAALSAAAMAMIAVWFALRSQLRHSPRELLSGTANEGFIRSRRSASSLAISCVCLLAAAALVGWTLIRKPEAAAPVFFMAGALMLTGLVTLARFYLTRPHTGSVQSLTAFWLVLTSLARRPRRSLATLTLLAGGAFIIISVSAFRLDARSQSNRPDSGTGGFALLANSSLPIMHDLNTPEGREALNLDAAQSALQNLRVVSFRVRAGEEASCLNLGRAQTPKLLGVHPQVLKGRFKFVQTIGASGDRKDWDLLTSPGGSTSDQRVIPAVGDANSIQWAMRKKIGDTIDYVDDQGRPFKVKIVGAVANSILQGSLIIDEAAFTQIFPGEAGYEFFLIDSPSTQSQAVAAALSSALADFGFECVSATDRLNQFNAVQNTYLGTFQLLGALGLLLGSVGLAVVIIRNLLDRRGELAVLLAAGFSQGKLYRLVLMEHVLLLVAGLLAGAVAAGIAILPAIAGHQEVGWVSLILTLAGVLLNGLAWAWLATRSAMRQNIVETLKAEA